MRLETSLIPEKRVGNGSELTDAERAAIANTQKRFQSYLKEPYRWNLPPQRIATGSPDYKRFVCRTGIFTDVINGSDTICRIGRRLQLTPQAEGTLEQLATQVAELRALAGAELRVAADMEKLRSTITGALWLVVEPQFKNALDHMEE